ncbi:MULTISPECIES: DUF1045 domain-containing protein [Alphaproteobacteria]|uniref:Phosphonate metabolism protein n=2 Tax=Alphaproteobacteria TaxID=28211 RepID=A0A512HF21_9HYPH|nr:MULTISPECIES: DUF1045 domain-containing protein [Alphaproteobacteria]GEO84055.1 hypothetical protein RNA01_09870 [Ciceribacter naphthalenivorans]GLR21067.1 hypothetical protein GCM10007920_08530 [Ciceribacter naphthalenivorans]GLT03923.1 hypothetical protein GCM10007926_08530 [Sphingomonas psychrolutea]
MRYAIHFTPSFSDPLTLAAASWLGRSVFSGESVEHPAVRGLGVQEIAFHTALPRRYGFHATLKAPFHLNGDCTEAGLLRELMRFAGTLEPLVLPRLVVGRIGNFFGLVPEAPCAGLDFVAAKIVQHFDGYRAPLSEAEIERRNPDGLSAAQFSNLHRWGHPYVMDEFRFHMTLTAPLLSRDFGRLETALSGYFAPLLCEPIEIANLALFVEKEPGAPFVVHSLHPMGRVAARRSA